MAVKDIIARGEEAKHLNNYKKALDLYLEAERMMKEDAQAKHYALLNNEIVEVAIKLRLIEIAEPRLREYTERKIKNCIGIAKQYINLAKIKCWNGNHEEAWDYLVKAEELAIGSDDHDLATVYIARASLLERQGDWTGSKKEYERAHDTLRRDAPIKYVIQSYYMMGLMAERALDTETKEEAENEIFRLVEVGRIDNVELEDLKSSIWKNYTEIEEWWRFRELGHPLSMELIMKVFKIFEYKCQLDYLGTCEGPMQIVHERPLSKNGTDELHNLRVYCRRHLEGSVNLDLPI
ncbi:MAG: tetratricopeptide repeat protein [Thermoplasmata archaeon]|nr:tetratricopeptide repeat protein [Thermoplasmata archaeon]